MSLFITELAFPGSPMLVEEAKLGILGGSLLSALAGALVLRLAPRPSLIDKSDQTSPIVMKLSACSGV
jgi:Na+/H+ antiporter NhaA